jgi:serine phosphatase RsbU (regulator of sigma subunit)
MRTHCIALVTPPRAEPGAAAHGPPWWDPIFRAWPRERPVPRLELRAPDELLSDLADEHAQRRFDAVVIATGPHGVSEPTACRLVDVLQGLMVPTLLLVEERTARFDEFHPGAVLVEDRRTDPAVCAAVLHTLAARQTAVRQVDRHLRLAQSFQGETAAEIDRLHQELLLAARVQRDFMPKHMPEVDGLEAAVLFRPAGFVSGDTYDVSRVDEHHVSFFLADAMGHGVPAALMTLYLTGSLPRKEIGPGGYRLVPPGEALARLNNGLQECMAGPARFATAICGVVDTRSGVITMACAGHPPPLRVSRHGVRPVDVSGMLLGVVSDYQYDQVSIRLEPGELLVLHSDGIEAAFGPRDAAPSELPTRPAPTHYLHLAGLRRGESLRDLTTAMRRLAADIDAQSGSLHQDDDLTVLALSTGPSLRDAAPDRPAAATAG